MDSRCFKASLYCRRKEQQKQNLSLLFWECVRREKKFWQWGNRRINQGGVSSIIDVLYIVKRLKKLKAKLMPYGVSHFTLGDLDGVFFLNEKAKHLN